MSSAGATPGRTCAATGFQVAAEERAVHSAVVGRTASPRQEMAQAASAMHPGQWWDDPLSRLPEEVILPCSALTRWL